MSMKHRRARSLSVATWAFSCLAIPAMASAQGVTPIEIPECAIADCNGSYREAVVEPGSLPWTPDHRPVMMLPLYNGSFELNPRGLSWGWYHPESEISYSPPNANYTQALSLTIGRLDSEYAAGWRRFMLYLPAGGEQGHKFSGHQWTALLPWMQHLFQNDLKVWIAAHPEATVGIYTGWIYRASDPSSLCTDRPNSPPCTSSPCSDECPSSYTVLNPDGLGDLINNTAPWMVLGSVGGVNVGIKEMFFDLAGGAPDELVAASQHSAFYNTLHMGGEAVPLYPILDTPQCDWIVHPCYQEHAPWVASLRQYWNNGAILANVFRDELTFDPTTTELGVLLDDGPIVPNGTDYTDPSTLTLKTMICFVAHGYVPWSYPDFGFATVVRRNDLLKRIYGFGTFDVRDFNADGVIDPDDLGDFISAYTAFYGSHGNCIHGDVNGDGDVNADDMGDYLAYFFSPTNPGVDFGGPNPEYVFPLPTLNPEDCPCGARVPSPENCD